MKNRVVFAQEIAEPVCFYTSTRVSKVTMEEPSRKSRGFVDIMAHMVRVCQGGAKKTHIMYRANLSYEMLGRYLKVLLEYGLVERNGPDGLYRASVKGVGFVKDYEDFKRLAELYAEKRVSLLDAVGQS